MKVRILPSSPNGTPHDQHLISFLVNGTVAIDGGCLGLQSAPPRGGPADVFLTHAHLDHVATLPLYIEDRNDRGEGPIRIHGSSETLEDLRRHFFNAQVWVDDARLRAPERPWVELLPMRPETPVRVGTLTVTAVPVHHTVPTYGYVVDDGTSAIVFGADSGPTERLWQVALATGRLRAAFVECSFPDALLDLATLTGHLTPGLLGGEAGKLPAGVEVIAVHLKPRFRERIIAELKAVSAATVGALNRDYLL